MDKGTKLMLGFVGGLMVLFLVINLLLARNSFKKNLSYSFNGVVESARYDEKGTPMIMVNHQKYILSAGYNFEYQIQSGDILKKERGSTTYTLIKQKTGKVMLFTN